MRTFTLTITTENAAFHDDESPTSDDAAKAEIARILRDAAKHVENGSDGRTLHDSNGNRVGRFDCAD
jgi:hypothetical protein